MKIFFLFVKHCTKNVMSTIHLIVFFSFLKRSFLLSNAFCAQKLFSFAFISKIYINIMTCYLVVEHFSKKKTNNLSFLLHSFHIYPKCEGLFLLHYVVCKHLADVLLKILLHKIDTCICTTSSRA